MSDAKVVLHQLKVCPCANTCDGFRSSSLGIDSATRLFRYRICYSERRPYDRHERIDVLTFSFFHQYLSEPSQSCCSQFDAHVGAIPGQPFGEHAAG